MKYAQFIWNKLVVTKKSKDIFLKYLVLKDKSVSIAINDHVISLNDDG